MREFFIAISILGVFTSAVFADNAKISQEEVNSIVWEQISLLKNDEHCRGAILHETRLKRKGVTDVMLASAYSNAFSRATNSSDDPEGALRFGNAVWGFARISDSHMLPSLMNLIENSTNELKSAIAVCAYHSRTKQSIEFASFARKLLLKSNRSPVMENTLWKCLFEDYFGPNCPKMVKAEIEYIAKNSLDHDDSSASLANSIRLAPTRIITQESVDNEIDHHIMILDNREDIASALLRLSSKGATQQMITDALTKILRRDTNCEINRIGLQKADTAIYWLTEYATGNDFTSFVFVAREATNSLASTAWDYFSRKSANRKEVVEEGIALLNRPNMQALHSRVWDVFEKEVKGSQKATILSAARLFVNRESEDAYRADIILCGNVAGYSKSLQHYKVLHSLCQDSSFRKQYPASYERVLKEFSAEANNETR